VVRAYLDAGSASMLLQLVLGGFAAVAVGAKLYWGRLMRFLRIRKPEPEATEPSQPSPTPGEPEPGAVNSSPAPDGTAVERALGR
jgi:hypothetical protein